MKFCNTKDFSEVSFAKQLKKFIFFETSASICQQASVPNCYFWEGRQSACIYLQIDYVMGGFG